MERGRNEAAHVRMSDDELGKPITGIGIKPDDNWALPLCRECHAEQHRVGERVFWNKHRISPCVVAMHLYAEYQTASRQRLPWPKVIDRMNWVIFQHWGLGE